MQREDLRVEMSDRGHQRRVIRARIFEKETSGVQFPLLMIAVTERMKMRSWVSIFSFLNATQFKEVINDAAL